MTLRFGGQGTVVTVKLAYFNYYLMSFSDGNGVTVSTVGTQPLTVEFEWR